MKYVLITKKSLEYISGVFSSKKDSREYLANMDSDSREKTKIIEVKKEYPFFLTEDHLGFRFFSNKEIGYEIDKFIRDRSSEQKDHVYTNLYLLESDFIPKFAGTDQMGILPHYHVDDEILNIINKRGFDSLWT